MFHKLLITLTLISGMHVDWEVSRVHAASSPALIVGQLVDAVRLRGTEDVFLQGDFAYLPCREGKRLTICSIQDPAHPQIVSSFTHPQLGEAAGFAINGDTIYLTSMSTQRLLVIDVTDKSSPRLLSSVKVGDKGVLYKAAYRGGYCYIPNLTEKKLFIVDVHNPKQPTVVGSVSVTTENDGPFSVMLRGDYALVGTIFGSRNRLAVVNVKDPAQPRLVTQVFGPDIGQVSGDAIGNLYYSVYWNNNAFLIFDISDPGHPRLQAKLVDKRLGKPNRCIVSGNRAYLPMVEGNGVAVIDISNSRQPKFLTAYRDPVLLKKTYGVAVRDNLLFVASREGNSLVILDRRVLEKK
ncbi:MAG: hypothetical protein P1V19_09940 [Gimesia sp.]|nr:hypothetical protein [Gimesia sp.]